jgi:uncharacterized protein (TIGR00369 family)
LGILPIQNEQIVSKDVGKTMPDRTDLQKLVETVTARSGFANAIGTKVVAVEEGTVHMAVDRRPDLLQFNGHFHGGVIATLADHAAGGAVTTALPDGKIGVTIDLHVNYLAPARGETLHAKARSIQVGSTIGVAQVDLFTIEDGTEHACAVALVTLRAVDIPGPAR